MRFYSLACCCSGKTPIAIPDNADNQSLQPIARNSSPFRNTRSPFRNRQKPSIIALPVSPRPPSADELSAAIRKQENEESCAIYKLPKDELKLIFEYIGGKNYRFIACTSYRFQKVYLAAFAEEALTSIRNAAVSVSCTQLYLDSENPGYDTRVKALFLAAARGGQLNALKWGEDSGYDMKKLLDWYTFAQAALFGHLEVVKYLRRLGIAWDEWTCASAARGGHLELLKWVRANQCPWTTSTCRNAARNGHLTLLKWARANQCPWNERTCSYAAENGHLKLLKWARANQCPWDDWTCRYAAMNGHLELLKWARSHGCPWDKETYKNGKMNGDPALMRYLEAEGCPM